MYGKVILVFLSLLVLLVTNLVETAKSKAEDASALCHHFYPSPSNASFARLLHLNFCDKP